MIQHAFTRQCTTSLSYKKTIRYVTLIYFPQIELTSIFIARQFTRTVCVMSSSNYFMHVKDDRNAHQSRCVPRDEGQLCGHHQKQNGMLNKDLTVSLQLAIYRYGYLFIHINTPQRVARNRYRHTDSVKLVIHVESKLHLPYCQGT